MAGAYLGSFALGFIYILSIFGWSAPLSHLFDRCLKTFWNLFIGRFILGLSSLYAIFVLLSIAGRLYRLEVGIVIGVGALLAGLGLPSLLHRATDAVTGAMAWPLEERVLAISVGGLALLQLIFGLTPLIFYDLQTYHLFAPNQFLMSGSLSHIPWNVQASTPLALQLIAGMSVALDPSGQIAKFLFTLVGCLAAIGVFEFLRESGRRAGLLAALFVLCFPEFWVMQTLGVTDLAIAGLMVFGAMWLRESVLEAGWRTAVLAGLALGMAVGSRYQAGILTLLIFVVVLVETCVSQRRLPAVKSFLTLATTGSFTFLMMLPWLIRNYVHFGNPVFPFMQTVWGNGGEWSAAQAAALRMEALGPSFLTSTPVQMTIFPIAALMVFPSNGLFGLSLLFGSLMGFTVPKASTRIAGVLGLGGLIVWSFLRPSGGAPLLRYNALSLVFLLAVTGAALGCEWIPPRAATRIAFVLAGGSFLIAMVHVHSIVPAAPSLISPGVRDALHRSSVPAWQAFDFINEKLSREKDKVLLFGETRGFWLQIPAIAPSSFNGPQLEAIFAGDSDSAVWEQKLAALGVTHLLLSYPEIEKLHEKYGYLMLSRPQAEKFNRWLHDLPKLFEDGRGTLVLALDRNAK